MAVKDFDEPAHLAIPHGKDQNVLLTVRRALRIKEAQALFGPVKLDRDEIAEHRVVESSLEAHSVMVGLPH